MAQRSDRILTEQEGERVNAFRRQIVADAQMQEGDISPINYAQVTKLNTRILGETFMSATLNYLIEAGLTPAELLDLAQERPGQLVRLYDILTQKEQETKAAEYVASLPPNDPQALADSLRAATGARTVTVGFDAVQEDGTVRKGEWAVSTAFVPPSEADEDALRAYGKRQMARIAKEVQDKINQLPEVQGTITVEPDTRPIPVRFDDLLIGSIAAQASPLTDRLMAEAADAEAAERGLDPETIADARKLNRESTLSYRQCLERVQGEWCSVYGFNIPQEHACSIGVCYNPHHDGGKLITKEAADRLRAELERDRTELRDTLKTEQ
jgi:hypothetical protein